jgi:hypothetical protein
VTAVVIEVIEGSFEAGPIAPVCALETPVLTITVNDEAVLTIARRLHDQTCLQGLACELRDFHALDRHEQNVRTMLGVMAQAATDSDGPAIRTCGNTRGTARRWRQGSWLCTSCSSHVRFAAGQGWIHIR